VKELVAYLLDNLYLDFQGEISLDTVRQFLRTDESREAKQLLAKLIEDKGVDDLLITLADCLKDHIRTGIHEETMREQLATNICRDAKHGLDGRDRVIEPGHPERSVVVARLRATDPFVHMPRGPSHVIDQRGVAMLEAWIASLPAGCP